MDVAAETHKRGVPRDDGATPEDELRREASSMAKFINTLKFAISGHRLDSAIWTFIATEHLQRQLRSLGVSHQRYTLHRVEQPITGFSIATYQNYDAGVDGSNDTSKKKGIYSIQTCSPKKLQTFSVLSQRSPLVSLQNKTTESPATSPCSHVATERVDEFTPCCTEASSHGALPTPSCLLERHLTTQ